MWLYWIRIIQLACFDERDRFDYAIKVFVRGLRPRLHYDSVFLLRRQLDRLSCAKTFCLSWCCHRVRLDNWEHSNRLFRRAVLIEIDDVESLILFAVAHRSCPLQPGRFYPMRWRRLDHIQTNRTSLKSFTVTFIVRSEFGLDFGACSLFKYILVTLICTLHNRPVERRKFRSFQCAICGEERLAVVRSCLNFIDAIHAGLLSENRSLGLDLLLWVRNRCKLCCYLRYSIVLLFLV